MNKVDTSEWKEFKIKDLFYVFRGKALKIQDIDEGKVMLVAAARQNQGVAGYYDIEPQYHNAITVSCNGAGCGSKYYHTECFAITGDAAVLIECQEIPEEAKLYIASILDKQFSEKYSYEDKCSPDKIKGETILLPAKETEEPDWQYMEDYMRAIEKEAETKLKSLSLLIEKNRK